MHSLEHLDTHICLVSAQQVVNLLPLLSEHTRPQEVILLVTPAMQGQAATLRRNLRHLGCEVYLQDIDSYDIQAIREVVFNLLLRFEKRAIGLNITGGTKIMALGAFEAFGSADNSCVFYVDTANQRIIHLLPEFRTEPLPDMLTVKAALKAYGLSLVSSQACSSPQSHRKLTEHLIRHVAYYAKALSILNYYAAKAGDQSVLQVGLEQRHLENPRFSDLIQRFSQAGCLEVERSEDLRFVNERQRRFVQGGWLEVHVAGLLKVLRDKRCVHDCLSNVQVSSRRGVENELDLAFTARNRLHLIECKTVRYQPAMRYAKGDQAAYKLDTLRDIMAGTFGRAMIVSYRELTRKDRQRCRDLGVAVVEAGELVNLSPRLEQWITPLGEQS